MTGGAWIVVGLVCFFIPIPLFPIVGLVIIVYGLYLIITGKKPGKTEDSEGNKVYRFGKVTILPERGVLKYKNKEVPISEVTNVNFEQKDQGYAGGGVRRIEILTSDIDDPVITFKLFAATRKELDRQYHQLRLLLNCRSV